MDVAKLIELHPQLYHMTEAGSWPSIRRHGLLSTSEIVRRAELSEGDKTDLCLTQRSENVSLSVPGIGPIVLRDQSTMRESRLRIALSDGTTPQQWYELINTRVFFWASELRLLSLLTARHYRDLQHDVLTIDTASFLAAYAQNVWLCHMNSGNTFPVPHRRGRDAFRKIEDYPTGPDGVPLKKVVEVSIQGQVPDIARHVIAVRRMKRSQVLVDLNIEQEP